MSQNPSPTVSFLEKLRDGSAHAERRPPYVYVIDTASGRPLAIQPLDNPSATLAPHVSEDGWTTYIPRELQAPPQLAVYSPLVIDTICDLLAKGGSLTTICTLPGMPSYRTLTKWRRHYPEVAKALEEARQDRAETLRDKALHLVEGELHRHEVPGKELQVETLWRAAGVDDVRYSPRAKVESTVTVPTQIIVETGIRRESREAAPAPTPNPPGDTPRRSLLEPEVIPDQEPLGDVEEF